MINTVWGSTDKPVASKRLAQILSAEPDLEGTLYIGYPIIGTPEGSFPIDALLVSPTKGLVLFSVVEGKVLPDYAEAQDEGFNKMQAKLLPEEASACASSLADRRATLENSAAVQIKRKLSP